MPLWYTLPSENKTKPVHSLEPNTVFVDTTIQEYNEATDRDDLQCSSVFEFAPVRARFRESAAEYVGGGSVWSGAGHQDGQVLVRHAVWPWGDVVQFGRRRARPSRSKHTESLRLWWVKVGCCVCLIFPPVQSVGQPVSQPIHLLDIIDYYPMVWRHPLLCCHSPWLNEHSRLQLGWKQRVLNWRCLHLLPWSLFLHFTNLQNQLTKSGLLVNYWNGWCWVKDSTGPGRRLLLLKKAIRCDLHLNGQYLG